MYRSRGTDVNPTRLIFTGDVYDDVQIPLIQDTGSIVVIEHPCAIRGSHSHLNEYVLVAAVSRHDPVGKNGWTRMHYDLTPLPDLKGDELYVGELQKIGRAATDDLRRKPRIACSSEFGINLLQQRLVWHLTRCFVPTASFAEAFSHTFEEADIAEDWIDLLTDAGMSADEAASMFDEFLTQDIRDGRTLQKDLQDLQLRSAVRTACRSRALEIASTR